MLKKSTEFKTMYLVLGIVTLSYVYFLKNNYESYVYVIPILLFFDVISIVCFRGFIKLSRRREPKPVIITIGFFSIYVWNTIVLSLLIIISIKLVNKLLFPMTYLFDKVLSTDTIVTAFTISMPYLLITTVLRHFMYLSDSDKKKIHMLKLKNIGESIKYQELKAQLSPHFLFNNLSVLTSLIEENQERAAHFSENLSLIYRYFLDNETEDLVVLSDELDFVNKYIELLKYRFEDALICSVVNKNSEEGYILPLAIQQAIENVTKHNEISRDKPIHIQISICKEWVEVQNNINPMLNTAMSSGVGIKNIEMRYSYFTDKTIKIEQTENTYKIELPILRS